MTGHPAPIAVAWSDKHGHAVAMINGNVAPIPNSTLSGMEEILALALTPNLTERTVLVDTSAMQHMGIPLKRDRAKTIHVTANGWTMGTLGPSWVTYRSDLRPQCVVHVWFMAWDDGHVNMMQPAVDNKPQLTILLLHAWAKSTKVMWRGTPGVTGCALMRALGETMRPQPLWHHDPLPLRSYACDFQDYPIVAPHVTSCTDTQATVDMLKDPSLHLLAFDARRAYLAAFNTVEVARGELQHTGAIEFDARLAGWWRVTLSPWTHVLPCPFDGPEHGSTWMTTPVLKILDQMSHLGIYGGFTVHETYTAKGSRLFRTWAETVERIYQATEKKVPDVARDVKQVYRETWGMMARPHGSIHRPDWFHAIQDQSLASTWRTAYKVYMETGKTPVSLETDCLMYNSNCEDATIFGTRAGIPLGNNLGAYQEKVIS